MCVVGLFCYFCCFVLCLQCEPGPSVWHWSQFSLTDELCIKLSLLGINYYSDALPEPNLVPLATHGGTEIRFAYEDLESQRHQNPRGAVGAFAPEMLKLWERNCLFTLAVIC